MSRPPQPPAPRASLRFGGSRGFTLIELMVVVLIIGILATISVPLFAARMRERRSQQTALQVAGIYREARMRALGRGAAVFVGYEDGAWKVREGVEGADASKARTGGSEACQNLPTRGCTTNDWGNETSREVGSLNPAAISSDITAQLAFDGSAETDVDLCFSPMGRSFVRVDGGAWSPMTSVLTVDVKRGDGLTRKVVVLPNGTSRLAL